MPRLDAQTAGVVSMVAALLVPSWWVLPQVLAGLGIVSVLSAGCILWLERFQPLFATVAASALAYQAWLVWRRAPSRRTRMMKVMLWTSVSACLAAATLYVGLWLRYR